MILLFEEFNDDFYKKCLSLALKEIAGEKRIPCSHFIGVVGMVRNKMGLAKPGNKDLPQDLVYACKEAVEDHFWGGVEPEWPMEMMTWWEGLDSSYFVFEEGEGDYKTGRNPYKNTTVPFLAWKDKSSVPKININ